MIFVKVIFLQFYSIILDNFTKYMSVKNCFSEMPTYARICRIIPENASKRQWHGPYT